jgi:hypothetical protein
VNRLGLPLVLAFALATAGPVCSSSKENPAMTKKAPSASRPAPPQVDPVEYQGVRYQQDGDALRHGADQASGYLVAVDPASGARLWMLKVYLVPAPTAPGLPSFGRYFRRMTLLADTEQLEIENEAGGVYRVDLRARTSTWISGPDSKP